MRLSKGLVLKQLAVVAGLVGAGTLLSLPVLAASSQNDGITIAQTTNTGEGGVNPANPDAEGGEAFEEAPNPQPLPNDTNEQGGSGTTMDEGTGSGQGGVQDSEVNPANPDAEGGEAFEREPSGEPLPSETENGGMDGGSTAPSDTPSGTTTNEGSGSGLGGTNNPVNPANPDPTGGEAYEQTPGTPPLPESNEQSGGSTGTGTYNQSGSGTTNNSGTLNQSGTTNSTGAGGGAGGASNSVRGLW